MMSVATAVCVGLCVAIWYVSPPAPDAEGCAVGAVQCAEPDPFCYRAASAPDGICTRLCPAGAGCLDGWCCVDPAGAADPRYFVCAPPESCADPDTAARRVAPQGGVGGDR